MTPNWAFTATLGCIHDVFELTNCKKLKKVEDVDFLLKMDGGIESIRCCHVNAELFAARCTLDWSQMTAKLYSDAAIPL